MPPFETEVRPPSDTDPPAPEVSRTALPSASFWRNISLLLALALAGGVAYYYFYASTPSRSTADEGPQIASVETKFQSEVDAANDSPDVAEEWRAARSDHRLIANLISQCLGYGEGVMTRAQFSQLMLDLRPNGNHGWRALNESGKDSDPHPNRGAADQSGKSGAGAAEVSQLTHYESSMLAASDAVARARLAAARGADRFYPDMQRFGFASVVLSAIATLLVTIKSSMGANTNTSTSAKSEPASANVAAKSNFVWFMEGIGPFFGNFFAGVKRTFLNWVGPLAIIASTTVTALTGVKQFQDPTNAYMRNETALLSLRQLHTEISLTFVGDWDSSKCKPFDNADPEPDFDRWRNTLVSLQSGTLLAPVIISTQNNPAQQDIDNRRRGKQENQQAPEADKASAAK